MRDDHPVAPSKKVLFLDVDGVLNHHRSLSKGVHIDPECVCVLDRIMEQEPDLDIVISSVWRGKGLRVMRAILESTGLRHSVKGEFPNMKSRIVDVTGKFLDCRGREIETWLNDHPEVEQFVILDDDSDMLPEQLDRFVQIPGGLGLMEFHIKEILEKLNGR